MLISHRNDPEIFVINFMKAIKESLVLLMMCTLSALAVAGQAASASYSAASKSLTLIELQTFLHNQGRQEFRLAVTGGGAYSTENFSFLPHRLSAKTSVNSLCRLAIKDLHTGVIHILSAPPATEIDQCKGLSKPLPVDLNDDGIPDYVFKTKTKSNVGNFSASQYLVFVSRKNAPGSTPFCFSRATSDYLSDEIDFEATNIYQSIKKENHRRNITLGECDS
jgi:hypothetical protein